MIKYLDIKPGTEISCRISSLFCEKAKIQIEDNYVYICQNIISGDHCKNKLGFEYSWSVGPLECLENYLENRNISNFFRRTNVTEVTLLTQLWDKKENNRKN